jgi:hypothetical protein
VAKFTPIEKKLMKRISDDRLNSNLAEIREAMEDLWPNDPVRIIEHYTDHGVKHSERLVANAAKILVVCRDFCNLDLPCIPTYSLSIHR